MVVVELEVVKPVSERPLASTLGYAKLILDSKCFARQLYSATATYEVLLLVDKVFVGMYLLVSDTVVVVTV